MSNRYITNLGRDSVKSHCIEKKVAWPIYVWKALIPEAMLTEIDILQKLVLSLAKIKKLNDYAILESLKISGDLIDTVKKSCIDKNYLTKDLNITEKGLGILTQSNSMKSDVEATVRYEKVLVFRDAITGDIVPNFYFTTLPQSYIDKDDRLVLEENYKYKKKPTFHEINIALKTRKNINNMIKAEKKDYAVETTDMSSSSFSFDFDEEVDWEDVGDDGEVTGQIKIEENNDVNHDRSPTFIKIWDDFPETIYVDSSLYVDPDLPHKLNVVSPLGNNEDMWFTSHLISHAKKDSNLQEEIEFFFEEARDRLKDQYPFNNDLEIELFVQFPAIANYQEFSELKEELESAKRAHNRILEGHQDYDTFFMRCQRTLECMLKLSISKIENRFDLVNRLNKYDFPHQIVQIANDLRVEVPRNLTSPQFYERLFRVARLRGNSIKDRGLFLLLDARYNQESKSLYVLKAMPEFYHSINLIADLRNKTAHYNTDEIDYEIKTKQVVKQVDLIVSVLFSHFFGR